ncbi:actin-like protein 10 [Penicillium chrysogenum]|uniref:Actin-like protein 10 n=1 Tax=Penicillium chrysogenum TaxID=5076 RepID=A0ABQ8X1J2_PENCH|nr:actin-like protein 10 [Penicillium chrysogenum]KAJ6167172.1 actin-like protein 10 [Penicillium chrysogenum]
MSQRHWSQGELVTVLSPPPPERFHPSGHTSYQEIEEPIVTGQVGQSAVAQIIIVHPTIKGGEEFFYELWPVDRGSTWVENFGLQSATRRWRRTRQCDDRRLRELAALRDQSPGQPKPSGGCSDFFKDRKLKPKPQCEKKHNKPNTAKKIIQTGAKLSGTVKAKTARAKEQAGANKRANAERKAQAKADKARAKEQAGANKRANAERKAQAKADKARAKEQQARANERASSEKKARDKAGKSRTSERARPGL